MLRGGSTGEQTGENENDQSAFGSFVRPGVKVVYASPKKSISVRILPAFDLSVSMADESFGKMWQPYRSEDKPVDEETQTPGFTEWFWPIMAYTYFGRQKKQFISALTGTKYYPSGYDPIRDCYKYVENLPEKSSNQELKKLTRGKTLRNEKKLPPYLQKTPREFMLMNALVPNQQIADKWDNVVLVVTKSCMKDLKEQLSRYTPRSDNAVISKEWPDFYYGDPTHPETGYMAVVTQKTVGNNVTSGFYLEQAQNSPETHNLRVWPVNEEALAGRYKVFDTDNVTNLSPARDQYQHVLDILVEDGIVPVRILKAACGNYGEIKESLRQQEYDWFDLLEGRDNEEPRETSGGGTLGAGNTSESWQDQETGGVSTAGAVGNLPAQKNYSGEQNRGDGGHDTQPMPATNPPGNDGPAVKRTDADVVKEDVPPESGNGESSQQTEKPADETRDSAPDDPEKEQRRKQYEAMTEKIKSGQSLDSSELTEFPKLVREFSG